MEVCEPKEILSFPATFRKTKGPSARMAEAKNIGTLGTFGAKQNSTVNSKFDSSNGMGNVAAKTVLIWKSVS